MTNKKEEIILRQNMRRYIQHQKTIIRKMAKDQAEGNRLIKEFLNRFHKKKRPIENVLCGMSKL